MLTLSKRVRVLAALTIAALFLLTTSALAQIVTDEPFPGDRFKPVSADLLEGRSNNIHILTLSDSTRPLLFESESGFQYFQYFQRGPAGFTVPLTIPDSTFHSSDFLVIAHRETFAYSAAVDHEDRLLFAWSKQRHTYTDVSSVSEQPSVIRCLRSTPGGPWQELSVGVRGLNPKLVIDEGDSIHLLWESPTPTRSDSNYDSYASLIMHAVCPPGGTFGTPQVLTQGFFPSMVPGRGDTMHLVWYQADSNRAQSFGLRYARLIGSALSPALAVADSVSELRVVLFQVDQSGTAHIPWQRDRWASLGAASVYLTLISGMNVETDSIAQSGLHEVPSVAVSKDGYDHVAWLQNATSTSWVLHYSTNRDGPLFSQVRTFQSMQGGGIFSLFLDRNENPRCVFSGYPADTASLKYLRDLRTGPDSVVTLSSSRSDIVPSLKFAVLDKDDRFWVAYQKITLRPQATPIMETRLLSFVDPIMRIPELAPAASGFSLAQNYPNPFNPATTIRYTLPRRSHVVLAIFNTLGQKVAELVNGDVRAGTHEVQFNGLNLASGVYFYRLIANQQVQSARMLLVR